MTNEIQPEMIPVYRCPICNKKHSTEKAAEKCMNIKPEEHAFQVGDVVKVKHYPGDYLVIDYLIVQKCTWRYLEHKQEPEYVFTSDPDVEGYYDYRENLDSQKLHLTAKQMKKLRKITKETQKKLKKNEDLYSDIEWCRKSGTYHLDVEINTVLVKEK